MLIGQYFWPVNVAIRESSGFVFDKCYGNFESYCLVITCYSMDNHIAVMVSLMKSCGAGKDVVHAWNSMGMVGGGETGEGSVSSCW